jgi:6-phosphofructokinase 1
LGGAAVDALLEDMTDVMVGVVNSEISYVPLVETWTKRKPVPQFLVDLAQWLV